MPIQKWIGDWVLVYDKVIHFFGMLLRRKSMPPQNCPWIAESWCTVNVLLSCENSKEKNYIKECVKSTCSTSNSTLTSGSLVILEYLISWTALYIHSHTERDSWMYIHTHTLFANLPIHTEKQDRVQFSSWHSMLSQGQWKLLHRSVLYRFVSPKRMEPQV